jgi:hypothetical protein
MAEGYFFRLGRADIDPHIVGAYLLRHAGAQSLEKTGRTHPLTGSIPC